MEASFQRTYEELKPIKLWNVIKLVLAGFQRTYEELKPNNAFSLSWRSFSFQRTYEELKLREKVFLKQSIVTGSQRTYKELKLVYPDKIDITFFVLSVPIRN